MSYRAIYAYAWDLAEVSPSKFGAEFRGLGLDTVTLAASYHAGKFLRPHGRDGKVYFPEDGTVYFRPDAEALRRASSRSRTASTGRATCLRELAAEHGIAAQCVARAAAQHAARRGLSRRDRRERLRRPLRLQPLPVSAGRTRLCDRPRRRRDRAAIRSSASRSESPGFLPYVHGFHHEFALMRPNRWLDNQLGLCFCDHCLKGAKTAGIDAEGLKAAGQRRTSNPISPATSTFPPTWPRRSGSPTRGAMANSEHSSTGAATVVTSLVSGDPGGGPAGRRRRGHPVGGAADRRRLVRRQRPRRAGGSGGHHRGLLLRAERRAGARRPLRRQAAAAGRREAARHSAASLSRPRTAEASSSPRSPASSEGGVNELAFYNWGHLRAANLAWIGDAHGGTRDRTAHDVQRQGCRHHRRGRRHRPGALPLFRRRRGD